MIMVDLHLSACQLDHLFWWWEDEFWFWMEWASQSDIQKFNNTTMEKTILDFFLNENIPDRAVESTGFHRVIYLTRLVGLDFTVLHRKKIGGSCLVLFLLNRNLYENFIIDSFRWPSTTLQLNITLCDKRCHSLQLFLVTYSLPFHTMHELL